MKHNELPRSCKRGMGEKIVSGYGMVVVILTAIGEHNLVEMWRNAEAVATNGTYALSDQTVSC